MERETGFEPATPSLEGSRSSQLSYSRLCHILCLSPASYPGGRVERRPRQESGDVEAVPEANDSSRGWWGEEDSNLRRHEPTDLQSAPFGRLGISPEPVRILHLVIDRWTSLGRLELAEGIEPPTG